ENLVFARAMGVDGILERTRSYRGILYFGAMTAAVTAPASLMAWGGGQLLEGSSVAGSAKGVVAVVCLSAAFLLAWSLLRGKAMNRRLPTADALLISASFNGASLGAVLLALTNQTKLLDTVVYALGCSVGLTLAMLLVHSGRERLEISNVPKSFSGLPITMIYIGILSLAIYGLIGHQLPT
ncbi:MAG: Rnf-Nqr domain containing protein, partial [Oscillospiraceae bacterium]